ncbi:MotA/TolQ/ExbB proton channel family protein [Flagellatimonas centrodinii]|uniref:MotA/TolQ/ExbB proton channel family protein n=1 Tax=Flagellatimonas centrodinii TaxID=2806210 RepID=UPI001FEFFDBC|nr:MotA/TolQ/ExbB proton channel family protein [Flagellatimonas centrodinii]ULQ47313.1 MotA/TolQ/ExbB proton channel family protein [Flagellatimonas centrodinii]
MTRAIVALALTFCSLSLMAAEPGAPKSIDELLAQTRAVRADEARANAARVQRFIDQLDQQQRLQAEAEAARAAEERRADRLSTEFDANERRLTELQQQLDAKAGHLGEMFGVVRQVAGDVSAVAMNSLVTVQYPQRQAPLTALANSTRLPSIEALETLWFEMLREMNESGKVARFQAPVVAPDGTRSTLDVLRAGSFNVVADDRFLSYLTGEQTLTTLAAQPERRFRRLAENLFEARDGMVETVIDPTRGSLLSVLVQTPGWREQVQAGGLVGYVILALGLFGLVIAGERFFALGAVDRRVRAQRQQLTQPTDDNPLGRVLNVYHRDPHTDHETLELRLDEAVLREIPALERRLPWLKILAAVAPLLGLLGTVTGMILTFQQITLFGTGDPKQMAGGISQALVTTVLGLVVAIPMVLLHSWLSGRSKDLVQVLEEESAGLIAENAERHRV